MSETRVEDAPLYVVEPDRLAGVWCRRRLFVHGHLQLHVTEGKARNSAKLSGPNEERNLS